MTFRLFPAISVFLGSYFPLAIILAVQDVTATTWHAGICRQLTSCTIPRFDHPIFSILGVLITGSCLSFTVFLLAKLRYKYLVRVEEVKAIPSELVSYSFPYIVSLMGIGYGSPGSTGALFIFLIWLFLITYRSGTIIMNPALLVLGWNLYEARVEINGNYRIVRILSKCSLYPATYKCQEISGSYITEGGKVDD